MNDLIHFGSTFAVVGFIPMLFGLFLEIINRNGKFLLAVGIGLVTIGGSLMAFGAATIIRGIG